MLQRLLGLPVLCCLCLAAEPLTPAERRLNTESFEYVWKTIHDKHWDLKGVDWQAIHDELRPKIERAETRDQARAVLRDMLGRLHETHFAIIPAEVYDDINDRSGPSAEGDVGLDARVIDGHALVTAVDVGSSAAAAGVRPGWEIAKIGGEALAPVLAKAGEVYRNSTLAELILARAVTTRLKGDRGEKVRVEFLDGANRAVDLDLARARPRGESAQFGFLPTQYVWFESRKIDNTGYIRFNIFLDPARIMTRFAEAVQSCASCDGMVIDLRGNPGGIGMMAMGMAGWFIDQPDQRLGIMYMKDTALKFVVNPRLETFRGPLAILVDGTSASTSEIFAGGMKDLGRARIFGTRTAAAALPSVIERLPDGDGFQYAVANYISEGGKPLEGIGVIPDREVKLTRQALLDGRDPVVDAALQWIKSKWKRP